MSERAAWMVVIVLLGAAGCGGEERGPRASAGETSAGHFEAVDLTGGISWRAGPPLVARRPSSEMRAAEYGVEGHDDVELAVFHFGAGEGGSVATNVDRWLEQLEQPDGRPTRETASIDERELDGMHTTVVDARGTFSGARREGAEEAREGFRLLGAIVEGEDGPVFFKLLGPEDGVESARPAFEALLASIRVAR